MPALYGFYFRGIILHAIGQQWHKPMLKVIGNMLIAQTSHIVNICSVHGYDIHLA